MRSRSLLHAVLSAAGLTLSAALIVGCAGGGPSTGASADAADSPHPGSLTIARPAASNGWEGDKCVGSSIQLNPAVYDSLLRIEVPDGDGLAPGLAESHEWDEAANAWVFHLRDDAAFSNGDPLTADDVAFSVGEWTAGEFSGSYYENIDHAEVVNDTTVKIVMKRLDTFLPSLLTWCTSTVYPADFAGMSREEFFENPIGAGPYAVESWDDPMGTSEKITFVPNENFYGWEGATPLDAITVEVVGDASQRALSFQAGDVDILESVDAASALQMTPEQLHRPATNPIRGLSLNMLTPGLDDPAVRQAISLAVDREAIATTLDNGSVAATGALPVNVPGAIEPTTPYTYDPDAAKELLEDAGVDDLTFTLLYDPSFSTLDTTAQTVQAQLAEVGITIELENTDSNTLIARQTAGDYDLTFGGASAISPTIWDPISWIGIQYTWTGSPSTLIQDEFLAGTSTLDDVEQDAHALAVQDFLTTDNGYIGLYNESTTYSAQDWVSGFTPLQYQMYYFDTLTD